MEHEEDHLDIKFLVVKNNLYSLDNLIDEYVEFIMECKTAGGIKEVIHMLIEDLYGICERDIMYNDILDKIKYLNETHIVRDKD